MLTLLSFSFQFFCLHNNNSNNNNNNNNNNSNNNNNNNNHYTYNINNKLLSLPIKLLQIIISACKTTTYVSFCSSTIASNAGLPSTPDQDGSSTSRWSRRVLTDPEPFPSGVNAIKLLSSVIKKLLDVLFAVRVPSHKIRKTAVFG